MAAGRFRAEPALGAAPSGPQQIVLLMDEILHRFSYVSHPFQTLNLNIGLPTTLRRGMCANDRNPASPTHSGNVEITGVRGARLLTMT